MNGLVEPVLWFIASGVFTCIAIYFIIKYFKIGEEAKPFILGWILFVGAFTIARTIETIRRYYVGSYFDIFNPFSPSSPIPFTITGLNLILRLLYYIVAWSAITIFFFILEKYIMKAGMQKNTRYILTLFSALEGSFSVVLYFTAAAPWNLLIVASIFFVIAFCPVIFFIYFAKHAITRSQRIAWLVIMVGFLLFLIGVMFDLPETALALYQNAGINIHLEFGELIRYGTPILQAVGGTLVGVGFATIYRNV